MIAVKTVMLEVRGHSSDTICIQKQGGMMTEQKRVTGRPPMEPSERRSHVYTIRFTESEYADLQARAARAHKSTQTIVKDALRTVQPTG